MENIPQPTDDAYTEGDRVCVYLPAGDADVQYHGLVCAVVANDPGDTVIISPSQV